MANHIKGETQKETLSELKKFMKSKGIKLAMTNAEVAEYKKKVEREKVRDIRSMIIYSLGSPRANLNRNCR